MMFKTCLKGKITKLVNTTYFPGRVFQCLCGQGQVSQPLVQTGKLDYIFTEIILQEKYRQGIGNGLKVVQLDRPWLRKVLLSIH
jgi:hypothetical protein